jgi:phosphoglycerate dehydrogenase-like enzyme
MNDVTRMLMTFEDGELADAMRAVRGVDLRVAAGRKAALDAIGDAEVACVAPFDAELLARGTRLRWVQAFLGGVEAVLCPELVASPIPLTCVKECFAAPGADHAMASILAVTYRLDYYLRAQARRTFEWRKPNEVTGRTLGIIGFGNIGQALARRARAFGMRVIAMARRPRADAAPADVLLSPADLPRLLGTSDFVVVAVPLTGETRGLIGPAQLARMKPTARLIDISGRPAIVNEQAVVQALQAHRIAGADLQFKKPPSPDSPLWQMDNLIMSQYSANSQKETRRAVALVVENLRRYRAGEPLLGLVDKAAGY